MTTAVRTVPDFTNGEVLDASDLDKLAKGWQLNSTVPSPVSGIGGTEVTVTTGPPTFTALTNRVFRISFSADVLGTNAGDLAQARVLWDGSNTIDDLTGWATVRTDDPVTITKSHLLSLAAGNHTIELQVARKDGSGTITCASSSHVTVEDMGSL